MQALRRATFLTRLVLAWWALALGVAVAAPLVQPQHGLQWICTAGGTQQKLLAVDAEGQAVDARAGLDCPLCTTAAPPPQRATAVPRIPAVAGVPAGRSSGGVGSAVAGLPGARAPPAG